MIDRHFVVVIFVFFHELLQQRPHFKQALIENWQQSLIKSSSSLGLAMLLIGKNIS
jgi:hypothetical protein